MPAGCAAVYTLSEDVFTASLSFVVSSHILCVCVWHGLTLVPGHHKLVALLQQAGRCIHAICENACVQQSATVCGGRQYALLVLTLASASHSRSACVPVCIWAHDACVFFDVALQPCQCFSCVQKSVGAICNAIWFVPASVHILKWSNVLSKVLFLWVVWRVVCFADLLEITGCTVTAPSTPALDAGRFG